MIIISCSRLVAHATARRLAANDLLAFVKIPRPIFGRKTFKNQLTAGFIASFNTTSSYLGENLQICDIWKDSAPHKINYKQLAIAMMILRRSEIEEKFFRIKLKLIE